MEIPISNIGEIQTKDVEKSSGAVLHNGLSRVCTIIKPKQAFDNRRDTVPHRMAKLFGGDWKKYNNHYIIQVSGCPLKCNYCYVDNLNHNVSMNADEIVSDFYRTWRQADRCGLDEINVLHLMGGAPGRYPEFWRELRHSLDKFDLESILFSDVVFVENYFYNVKPWRYMNIPNFILTGCLKGTNGKNFKENTGKDLFEQSLRELEHYADKKNFYLSLINYEEKDLSRIYSIIPKERIDFLKVVDYDVAKSRRLN